jgi:hypothetical protein
MFISNPEIMGVFAYPWEEDSCSVKDFLCEQKGFLKDYAVREDVPFVIFGE